MLMRAISALFLTALVLSSCQPKVSTEESTPVTTTTTTTTTTTNNAAWDYTPGNNGDFTFDHNPIESEYVIDVLYKGESVGKISLDAPIDGYDTYLMEEAGNKAFIAVNPTGLGGYILYGHAAIVYVYDFANQTFEELPVGSVDDISSDGNLVAYWTTWEGPSGEFWGLSVYDIAQKIYVSNYQVDEEFDEGGHATFSPSGKNLAFELAIKGDTVETHALFLGAAVGGEFEEMARQDSEYFSMDWTSNSTLKNFEAANQ